MHEAIRKTGLKTPFQAVCRSEEDVRAFWASLPVNPDSGRKQCVVKPCASMGGDSIYMCDLLDDAVSRVVNDVNGQFNALGQINDGALCEAYISGTEYAVDGVCRDGVFKVTAIWEYEKMAINQSVFVLQGMRLRSAKGLKEASLITYVESVLESVGHTQGAFHVECIVQSDGTPIIVEVSSGLHGGDGSWMPVAQQCIGYTQVEACLALYVRPDRFDALPKAPSTMYAEGSEIFFISIQQGAVHRYLL
jgi:biotin carboxylase